ncbi:hypothetical protein D5086_025920 [Populus alba]|uniref:Uncharacterized protein n=1 Tax=Populus alba TaxID=43335 RepID=A0ACC4B196_POPAL
MDMSTALLLFAAVITYQLWLTFISRSLKGPRVYPLLGSLPGLIENCDRLHDWIYDNLRACGGIFNSDGDTWLFQRKTAALEFTTRTLRQAMARWDPQTCAPGLPENSFASAFDRATEASLQRFILPEVLWKLKKWLRLGLEVSLNRSLTQLDDYLTSVIDARKKELMNQQKDRNIPHDDLLSRFMKKESYSDTFLQHVALNFILAGRDTSSVALCWFFWLLTQNPSVEEKILHEICTVLIKTRGDDDSKHVVADDVLPDGTFVPAGSSVTYSIYASGRMKTTWGEDCLEFKPERWLSSDGKKFIMHDSYKFVAFNAGPRICLGKDLAYLQMKSVAAAVLLRHRLSVVQGHKVEQKMSLTLFMKHGLKVNVHKRDLEGTAARIIQKSKEGESRQLLHGKNEAIAVRYNGGGCNGASEGAAGKGAVVGVV